MPKGVSFVGRVMSDDGHEPDKQSKPQSHAEAGRVHADFDHRKADWRRILVHGLDGRVGRLHHDSRLSRHLQQESTHRMGLHGHVIESDKPGIQGRVRQLRPSMCGAWSCASWANTRRTRPCSTASDISPGIRCRAPNPFGGDGMRIITNYWPDPTVRQCR